MAITIDLNIEILSEANRRDHWAKKYKRFKKQREYVRVIAYEYRWLSSGDGPISITLTRIKAPRQRDFDGDNLQSGFKAVRDGIADALKINDGSDRLEWKYRQEKGDRAGVRVEIERL